MFVLEATLVDCPFDDVVRRLERRLVEVLDAAADDTSVATEALRLKVAPAAWPSALAKTVVLRVGPVRRQTTSLIVALTWEPDGATALFPRLDGDLEVAPVGTSETALTLRGRYDPPAGALGRGVDALLLHRLAESTVRAFLAHLRDRLDPASDGIPERDGRR